MGSDAATQPPVLEMLESMYTRCVGNLRGVVFFFSMADSWLILFLIICQQPLWSFGDFLSSFAYDIYDIPPAKCALLNGAYPLGQTLGLALALIGVLRGGSRTRLSMYIVITMLAAGSAFVPIMLLRAGHRLSSGALTVLAGWQGFSCVLMDYVPTTIWAMHVGRLRGEGAHYLGILYSIGYTAAFAFNWYLGNLRNSSMTKAFTTEMIMASASSALSMALLTLHIVRNWNGTLFHSKG